MLPILLVAWRVSASTSSSARTSGFWKTPGPVKAKPWSPYIEGNAAQNYLFGGAGTDTMKGNDGNDVYYVDYNAYRLPPPRLGEHTDEVLTAVLGWDPARIEAARAAGAIGGARSGPAGA